MTDTVKSLHKTEFHFNVTLLPHDVGIATKALFLIEKVRCTMYIIPEILFFTFMPLSYAKLKSLAVLVQVYLPLLKASLVYGEWHPRFLLSCDYYDVSH